MGHCHPNVVAAIREQAGKLLHVSNLYYIEPQAKLAKLLIDNSDLDQCFFCNSGAEANEAAIKLARKYAKDRGKAHAHENHYNGEFVPWAHNGDYHCDCTDKYHKGFEPMLPGFTYVPFDDLEATEAAVNENTCAILVEAIQSEGGVNVPSEDYIQGLRSICDAHGLLLILDEVQTAMAVLEPSSVIRATGWCPMF